VATIMEPNCRNRTTHPHPSSSPSHSKLTLEVTSTLLQAYNFSYLLTLCVAEYCVLARGWFTAARLKPKCPHSPTSRTQPHSQLLYGLKEVRSPG
jgi:hypothetical protein